MSDQIYLALGTNIGDRAKNLAAARGALRPELRLLVCSPIYETPPWGYLDQAAFLNQVVLGETDLPPMELLIYLKRLEDELGRQESFRNGPRLIDLDLLFYGNLVLQTEALTIPHPRMEGRAFVLTPMADLAPDLRHPVLGKTIADLLQESDQEGIVLYDNNISEEIT